MTKNKNAKIQNIVMHEKYEDYENIKDINEHLKKYLL